MAVSTGEILRSLVEDPHWLGVVSAKIKNGWETKKYLRQQ
jgi:hypothetical protein